MILCRYYVIRRNIQYIDSNMLGYRDRIEVGNHGLILELNMMTEKVLSASKLTSV
jgi:hypothetical protein